MFCVRCCVCRKRLSSPRRSGLIDSAWVVIIPGQKCIKKLVSQKRGYAVNYAIVVYAVNHAIACETENKVNSRRKTNVLRDVEVRASWKHSVVLAGRTRSAP